MNVEILEELGRLLRLKRLTLRFYCAIERGDDSDGREDASGASDDDGWEDEKR